MFVFKIHSRCNLNCGYCYMYHGGDSSYLSQPKRVPWQVIEELPRMFKARHASTGRRRYAVVFHGGEPLLVGKEFFDQMMTSLLQNLAELEVSFGLQTNGVLIDDDWIALFEKHGLEVSLSLDGPSSVNRRNRVLHDGTDSTEQTLAGLRKLQRSSAFSGLLAVLVPGTDGGALVRYFRDELGIAWFDFLWPDMNYDRLPAAWESYQASLSTTLIQAFDEWFPSRQDVHCRVFDDMITRLTERPTLRAGDLGMPTIVIETDGTLETDDVLRTCRGFERTERLQVGAGALDRFLHSPPYLNAINVHGAVSEDCRRCQWFGACRGGHMAHRYSSANGFLNRSVHCTALTRVLSHVAARLGEGTRVAV